MITFLKWLEYADAGGETDYNGLNNSTYGLGVDSKYMSVDKSKTIKTSYNTKKIFGIKRCEKKMKKK